MGHSRGSESCDVLLYGTYCSGAVMSVYAHQGPFTLQRTPWPTPISFKCRLPLLAVQRRWDRESHHLFPVAFQKAVAALLLCSNTVSGRTGYVSTQAAAVCA